MNSAVLELGGHDGEGGKDDGDSITRVERKMMVRDVGKACIWLGVTVVLGRVLA